MTRSGLISLDFNTYPFWSGYQLALFWYSLPGTVAKKTRYSRVSWDAGTSILSAKLHGTISVPMGTTGQIYFNGEITHYSDGRLGDATYDAEIDVSGLLRNGENSVAIELTKFAGVTDQVGTFSAELIVEYTGTPPDVTEPEEKKDWWITVMYAGIAIGAIVAVAYVMRPFIEAKFKR